MRRLVTLNPSTLSRGGTSFDEKGMEVAPRPVSKDDLPFRPRSSDGRSWIQPAAPGHDPRAEIHIEARPFVSRRRHSLHPHVNCGWAGTGPKKKRPGCQDPGTPQRVWAGCGNLTVQSYARLTAFLSYGRTGRGVYTRPLCPRLYMNDRGLSSN